MIVSSIRSNSDRAYTSTMEIVLRACYLKAENDIDDVD